jgi:branched-chain amino acid transport system ATP-binding protein
MAEPLLQVRNLHKRFGAIAASQGLDLDVRDGEFHALIGPNGAGKTTALAQFAGEIQPDSGQILLSGRDVTKLPVHRRVRLGIARSYQITSIFPRLSAEDNVAMAVQAAQGHSFRFWRAARGDAALREPARALLARLGIAEKRHVLAAHLAHGEQRQLEVAMALACRPRLMLLDEPTAGLGAGGTRRMAQMLAGLKGEVAVLMVEHDMDAVFALADRISVLVYGRCIVTGTPEQIRVDPRVRHAYLGDPA